jgi:regulator of replication initiation timing
MTPKNNSDVERLLAETQELVTRLLRENRRLKSENERLAAELGRVSNAWVLIKKLAKQAPRARHGLGR